MAIVNLESFDKPLMMTMFVTICCLQNFLIAAPMYGFSSILVIFKRMKLYQDLCPNACPNFNCGNATTVHRDAFLCNEQAQALNWVYIFSIFANSLIKFPLGFCIDRYGPQICQYCSCVCLLIFGFFFGNLEAGREYLLYLSFLFLAVGSSFGMLSIYQAVNVLCKKGKSVIICLLSGAVDASSAIFVIFLVAYEAEVSLTSITTSYVGFSVLFIILLSTFLFPSKEDVLTIIDNDVKAQLKKGVDEGGYFAITHDLTCSYKGGSISTFNDYKKSMLRNYEDMSDCEKSMCYSYSQSLEMSKSMQISYKGFEDSLTLNPAVNHYGRTDEVRFKRNRLDTKVDIINENAVLVPKFEVANEGISVWECLFSWKNGLFVMLVSICMLKLLYFVGNLDKYYANFIQDKDQVTDYVKYFGYTQFMGTLLAPFTSLLFRGTEPRKNDTRSLKEQSTDNLKGCILPAMIIIAVVMLLDVLQMFQILDLSIALFILYLFGISLLFSFASVFSAIAFHPKHFCTIYGFCICVGGLVSMLQFPILTLELSVFNGNQIWTNSLFAGLLLLNLAFPIYLWVRYRKEKKEQI